VGRDHKTLYATNEELEPIWIGDVARTLGCAEQSARNALNKLVRSGRIRLDHKAKQIYLCGEVVPVEGEEEGEEKANELTLYQSISQKLPSFLNNLDPELREIAINRIEWGLSTRRRIEADAMAAARYLFEPTMDSVLRSIGFVKDGIGFRQARLLKLELIEPLPPPPWQMPENSDVELAEVPESVPESVPTVQSYEGPRRLTRGMGLYAEDQASVHTPSRVVPRTYPYVPEPTAESKLEGAPSPPLSSPADSGLSSSSSPATTTVEKPPVQAIRPAESPKPEEKTGGDLHDDVKFGRALVRAWHETGKSGHPNRNQLAEVCRTVPPEARSAYLVDVTPRMARKNWHNAAALPTDALEWVHAKWPLVQQDLARRRQDDARAAEETGAQRTSTIAAMREILARDDLAEGEKQLARDILRGYGEAEEPEPER
jgi:hypothetical protein